MIAEATYREHSRFVWGLCYRMTGSAADADDLVQETFARAITSPPANEDGLRPWLARVAMNLARDRLRSRKRTAYMGPWLPSPVDTGDDVADDEPSPETRYGLLESVSFAFLLACEALTPRQRAVLLLRDVLDYSVEETATALELTETNVKTTHHRARAAMKAYDVARTPPTKAKQQATKETLERFAAALLMGDVAAVESMLAPDARTKNDAGGEYRAAIREVHGASRVARFYVGLVKKIGGGSAEVRMMNGLPALYCEPAQILPRTAPRVAILCEIGADGLIHAVHTVLASRKLTAVTSPGGHASYLHG